MKARNKMTDLDKQQQRSAVNDYSEFRVLVVDDNDSLKEAVTTGLAEDSFQLQVASDGQQAYDKAINWCPHIVISDILMPLMDGYQFCQKLKACEPLKDTYFIFLTSKKEMKDMIYGLEIGGDDYLTKPFSIDELKARVYVGVCAVKQRQRISQLARELASTESQASISSLCASMSHEINSPLGAVSFNNSTMKKQLSNIEDVATRDVMTALVRDNEVALRHMKHISSSVKRLIRPESDRRLAMVSVVEEIDTALLMVSHRTQNPQIEISHSIAPETPPIYFYEGGVAQVLINLLTNSLEALRGEGRISISVSFDTDYLYISVKDDGQGVSPEVRAHIFNPLFSTKEGRRKSGLGLSICQEIMKANNGDIYLEDSSEQETVFILRCPLKEK